jgi:hypothetical protein
MRVNGTLEYLVEQTSSFDEDGVPTPLASTWSQPIECWIQTNTHNERGTYQDGKFTQASYLVLIERQHLDTMPSRIRLKRCVENVIAEVVMFNTSLGESFRDTNDAQLCVINDATEDDMSGIDVLGEYEVQDCQRVNLDRIKIIV